MDGGFAQTAEIFCVAPQNLAPVWSQVAELWAPEVDQRPTHTLEDLRSAILGMKAQLWIQWEKPLVEAALMTEFASYPRGVWVRAVLAVARDGYRMNTSGFLTQLEMWRDMHGCRGFECIGRVGWLKRIPDAKVEGVLMRTTSL